VRSLLLAAAVLTLVAALAAPAAHARPARDIAAVALHPWQLQDRETREQVFAGIAATGARWARIDMPWSWVEPSRPLIEDGRGHWGALDPIVYTADSYGIKLIGILGFTPPWASDSGELWTYPDAEPFEEFFRAALRRYPQIPAWELWNEPNFERFSKPGPNVAGFVEFLRSARRARDAVGSRAKLISGGIAPGGGIGIWPWIDEMAMRGGLALVDGFGIHPYSLADPDDPRSWMMQLEVVKRRLGELGRPDMPLWLTEFGSPTVPVTSGYGPPLSEARQAERLRLAFALAGRYDWIENLTWYEYRDSSTGSGDPEGNFGLVRSDLSRKPAWHALREVMAGATAKLRPRLFLATRMAQARVPAARARAAAKRRRAKAPASAKPRASAKPPSAKRRAAARRRAAAKRRRIKRSRTPRLVNRITVSGRLTLPGTAWPNSLITLRLPRRGQPPRTVTVPVKEGIFWARFEGRDLTSGTVEVSYAGSDAYQPLTTQIQVLSSVTTSR
jgi:polysaccharide biosynthesis protein PslG